VGRHPGRQRRVGQCHHRRLRNLHRHHLHTQLGLVGLAGSRMPSPRCTPSTPDAPQTPERPAHRTHFKSATLTGRRHRIRAPISVRAPDVDAGPRVPLCALPRQSRATRRSRVVDNGCCPPLPLLRRPDAPPQQPAPTRSLFPLIPRFTRWRRTEDDTSLRISLNRPGMSEDFPI
jgi:hypothetical protein